MATISQSYDHPDYIARSGVALGEAGGAGATLYGKFNAFTAMQAYSATLSVTVAGTTTNNWIIKQVSGTTTTALATATVTTSAAGTVFNLPLSATAGGVALLQGDVLFALSSADTASKVAVTYEVSTTPLSNVTK